MLITTVMPSSANAATSASTSRLACGSRLAVGSSRNSSARAHRPSARQREPLLLAARQHARRTLRAGPRGRRAPAPRARAARAAARGTPASHSASSRLCHTDRRSRNGRWNTIACVGSRPTTSSATRALAGMRRAGRAAGAATWSCRSRCCRPARCVRRRARRSRRRRAPSRRRSARRRGAARSAASTSSACSAWQAPLAMSLRRPGTLIDAPRRAAPAAAAAARCRR